MGEIMDSCAARPRSGLWHFKYGEAPSIYMPEQHFSDSALLMLWAGYFSVVGAVLCFVDCLATSLTSTH